MTYESLLREFEAWRQPQRKHLGPWAVLTGLLVGMALCFVLVWGVVTTLLKLQILS